MSDIQTLQTPVADALAEAVRRFDAELETERGFVRDLVARVSGYRGKMLRPTLLLLAGRACGELRSEHAVLAAVVEMAHVATLVHDDVLDEADLRRREPTVHRLSGNEAAVLLGDYLISHAYHLCSSLPTTYASRRIAAATNRVCEGELMQVHHRGDWGLSELQYLDIIRLKTAELTRAACELGAAYSDADPDTVGRLASYGESLGMAFQITDDLLDLTGSESEAGKTLGRDADLGKPTLAVIHALSHASREQREKVIAAASGHVDGAASLRSLLSTSGSVQHACDAARRYAKAAAAAVSPLPASPARAALLAAAEFVVNRRQ